MAQFVHDYTVDLARGPKTIAYLGEILYEGDAQADVIRVTVLSNGNAATLSGSVVGKAVTADGQTVPILSGTLTGNMASITLPAAAYVVGPLRITVSIVDGNTITTLLGCVAIVNDTTTDTVIDPGTIIPSVEALLAELQTVAATIPDDYTALSGQVQENAEDIAMLDSRTRSQAGQISDVTRTANNNGQKIGSLVSLVTPTKTDLVHAINEAYNHDLTEAYDTELSTTSENAVQNKAIAQAINEKMNKPVSGGTAGQCLMSDGQGSMVWGTPTEVSVVLGDLATKDRVQASYTPHGTVTKPSVTATSTGISVWERGNPGSVTAGTAATCTLPTLTQHMEGENLITEWTPGSFSANTPTIVSLPQFYEYTRRPVITCSVGNITFNGTTETITST